MKKILAVIITVLITLCPLIVFADKETEDMLIETTEELSQGIDWSNIESFWESVSDNTFVSGSLKSNFNRLIKGEYEVTAGNFLAFICELFFSRLIATLPSLLTIVVVSILCGIISKNKSNLLNQSTSEIVFLVCFGIVIISVLTAVWIHIESARETVQSIKTLSNLVLPVLLAFLSALGAKSSIMVFEPSIALLTNGIIELVCNIVLPLVIVTFVFTVVSNLSNNIRLDKMSKFFKNSAISIIGIAFTIFSSFLTIQGISSNTFDSVSIRTAKFATKNYVPILGHYLSDSFDLILASSMLIKNAFGIIGLLLLVVVVAFPIVEIFVFNIGLQIVSGIIEPVSDKRIVNFLSACSSNLVVLLVTILAVAFMLLIIIMLIISTANVF